MTVYLLHFSTPYKHARHYLGSTRDLPTRLRQHGTRQGARLMQAVEQAGIRWELARTWLGGREIEKQSKRGKNAPRLKTPLRQTLPL